jgi:hypothetical protein
VEVERATTAGILSRRVEPTFIEYHNEGSEGAAIHEEMQALPEEAK